jgi:N,N-dimethylformamidase
MGRQPLSPVGGVSLEGYADEIAIRGGERLRLMASGSSGPAKLSLVRLLHGDPNPKGPGYRDEAVDWGQPAELDLDSQPLDLGSFLQVPHQAVLNPEDSFSLALWCHPRLLDAAWMALAAKWRPGELSYAIFCTGQRTLTAAVSFDGARATWCTAGGWLSLDEWQFVCLSFDRRAGELSLFLASRATSMQTAPPIGRFQKAIDSQPVHAGNAPLLFGALESHDGSGHWAHFNGKIARPVLFSEALTAEQSAALMNGEPAENIANLLGCWDLSQEVSGDRIVDVSGNENHGVAVNVPARAVTGPMWRGTMASLFTDNPSYYDAVHLHDDDIGDAGWSSTLELAVPASARSGIYAFHLRRENDELYVPFIVRPASPKAPICVLVPTLTWQAYSTNRGPWSYTEDGLVDRVLGIYDGHRDGSMVYYVSRRRPTRSHHPSAGFPNWGCHNVTADLYLVDWLEKMGFDYDTHSDEDLHREGLELLSHYRCLIVGSHPEYWTGKMLDALDGYLQNGGRVLYLGGNGLFWVTSIDRERPWLAEVRKSGDWYDWWAIPEEGQLQHSTSLEPGGLWLRRARPPRRLLGVEMAANCFVEAKGRWGFRRLPASREPRYAWVFDGVDEEVVGDFGLNLGSAAAYEMDAVLEWDWPDGEEPVVLARATHEEFVPLDRIPVPVGSDVALRTISGGGAVFAAGSVTWTGSLSWNNYDNNISRITANVIRRFHDVPADHSVLVE